MVGVEFKESGRNGGTYRITGEFQGGWVIERVDAFESPAYITTEVLRARFGTNAVDAPAPLDEVEGWRVLGDKFGEAVGAQLRGEVEPPGKTPEQQFGEIVYAGPNARRVGVKK